MSCIKKILKKIKKTSRILFFLNLTCFNSISYGLSLDSNLFQDMVSLTLSQITKTKVVFQSFESSFSPKMKFKLRNVEFRKKNKTLLSAKSLVLEPSPMFLLLWKKSSHLKAFMEFNLEEGKTKKLNFKKVVGILRANIETISLDSTKVYFKKGEIIISGNYQKKLRAFDGTIITKRFELDSLKGFGLSGLIDLNTNILGYVNQEREIIPMSGGGKIFVQNLTIKKPSITKLFLESLNLSKEKNYPSNILNFSNISGNFTIKKGTLQSNNLNFRNNSWNINGKGEVNFLTQPFKTKFLIKKNQARPNKDF